MLEAFPQVPPHPNALPILHWETHMVRPLCILSLPHGIHLALRDRPTDVRLELCLCKVTPGEHVPQHCRGPF